MVDMSTDYYQKSDKLSAEGNSGVVAYQTGDFYVVAVEGKGGCDVSLYDSNMQTIKNTSNHDVENLTTAINQFCDAMVFDGVENLRNRSAEKLDFGAFMQNYIEASQNRNASVEVESQWQSNPEDSFAVFILNPTEHNEQLMGRDMAFLEKVGEDLDKSNFRCVYTDTISSLQQNDSLFYGEIDMAQHLQEALFELEQGDGEKLHTMIHVKTPWMGDLDRQLQPGCVVALKQEEEISHFFVEELDLVKVDFVELPPKVQEKSVEMEKEQKWDDVTPQQLVELMSKDKNLESLVHQASQLATISQNLESSVPFEDISAINDYAQDISMKYEDMDKGKVSDFIVDAIDNEVISVQDLENISYRDFFDAFQQEDKGILKEFVQAINHTEDKSFDNMSLDLSKDGELQQIQADIVATPSEVDMFSATLTTQERVIVHRATDFIYDYFPDYSEEDKSVMRDILSKVDTNGDLQEFYPSYADGYTFEVTVELFEKTTIEFSGEELEMISEVCSESSRSWDDITDDYIDLVYAVIDKVENPQLEVEQEILQNLGNLADEQKDVENTVAPRMVARSYEIFDSVVMGGEEIAVGESPSGMAGTWERSIVADEDKGVVDNWYSGHYFDSKEEAMEDFQQRIEDKLEEREAIYGELSIFSDKEDSKASGKDKSKDDDKKDSPRQSVLTKLKELKQELAPKENKEQPTKGKDNQTL